MSNPYEEEINTEIRISLNKGWDPRNAYSGSKLKKKFLLIYFRRVLFLNSYFITHKIPCNLAGIDTEWRKTQCMPREVCVDVGKEFGATTNTFFKPPCVSIYRCGGCCNSEGLQCMNISTNYISKTVSFYSYCSPNAPCKSIYDHAYFKPFYCYFEKGKKGHSRIHRKNS